MNRPIPFLGSRKIATPSIENLKGATHLALPVLSNGELSVTRKWLGLIEREFEIDLQDEIVKAGKAFTAKLGELIEIPLNENKKKLSRILLVGVGEANPNDLRKVGTILGRKVKATNSHLLSFCCENPSQALVHLNALALSTYTWSTKSSNDKDKKVETPSFTLVGDFSDVVKRSEVLV
ncbi:MAG: M17 family peptidase N-terminal domain-containing protein, partial [Candidatus Nanopelagicaceae bacterium]